MTETVEWCAVVWQVVDGTSAASSAGWTTFGVAALTGVFGVLGILIGQKNQARSQARSVRAALLAEVAAIKELLITRGYLEELKKIAADLKSLKSQIQRKAHTFEVATADRINNIYRANLAHLGGLSKDEAVLIVRFNYLLEGFFVDITNDGRLVQGTRNYKDFETAVSLLEEILEIAEKLTRRRRFWCRCGQNVDTEAKGNAG